MSWHKVIQERIWDVVRLWISWITSKVSDCSTESDTIEAGRNAIWGKANTPGVGQNIVANGNQ